MYQTVGYRHRALCQWVWLRVIVLLIKSGQEGTLTKSMPATTPTQAHRGKRSNVGVRRICMLCTPFGKRGAINLFVTK